MNCDGSYSALTVPEAISLSSRQIASRCSFMCGGMTSLTPPAWIPSALVASGSAGSAFMLAQLAFTGSSIRSLESTPVGVMASPYGPPKNGLSATAQRRSLDDRLLGR